jgi:hypothetical protein
MIGIGISLHLQKIGVSTPPVNTVLPGISGTPTNGSVLTVIPGTYTGSPSAPTYQWYANGVAIVGATNTTFTVGINQLEKVITVVENVGSGVSATSLPTVSVYYTFTHSEASTFVASQSPIPEINKYYYDDFVSKLKTGVITGLTKFDYFYLLTSIDRPSSLKNIINPAGFSAALIETTPNTLGFTPWGGYSGFSADGYLGAGRTPVQLVKYTQNDAHFGVYVGESLGSSSGLVGAETNQNMQLRGSDGTNGTCRINGPTITFANVTSAGGYIINRTTNANVQIYRNGNPGPTFTNNTSTTKHSQPILFGRQTSAYCASPILAEHGGASLNATEAANVNNAIVELYQNLGILPGVNAAKLVQAKFPADINGRSYRDASMVTTLIGGVEYQVQAYWNIDAYAIIQYRTRTDANLPFGTWTSFIYDGTDGLPVIQQNEIVNDHKNLNVGFDRDGYVHLAYNNHNNPLVYRRASQPITSWTGAVDALTNPFPGASITSYTKFFNDPSGKLYLIYRNGGATAGGIAMSQYSETTGWSVPSGLNSNGELCNETILTNAGAYPYSVGFDPDFGSGGHFHFAWHWKVGGGGNQQIGYLRWDGTNWKKADNSPQTMPAAMLNQDTVENNTAYMGLGGQNSCKSDHLGRPHIAYIINDLPQADPARRARVRHAYHNGTSWVKTDVLISPDILDCGDPENDFWRCPDIAINQTTGKVYILLALFGSNGLRMLSGPAPYTTWSTTVLDTTNIGEWSPTFDEWQWRNHLKLWIPVQSSLQLKIIEHTPA